MTNNRIMQRAHAICRRNLVHEPGVMDASNWLAAVALALVLTGIAVAAGLLPPL